ncbi:hypothetical protein DAPPUDRAFT_239498 [Daphnia pulex]|uniref:Uncharacterized protein n=1 Tax=Daphnia pulex TaxID=6669 RepID=E9G9H5_DAPPU|nr:hypothetical protein DAPPUDRAFT_239498 [Daphnia pulex]|eukprot:EFX83563.1 hypothetical protein DAPPUDRAFT_239498 [Daphnia pulex]
MAEDHFAVLLEIVRNHENPPPTITTFIQSYELLEKNSYREPDQKLAQLEARIEKQSQEMVEIRKEMEKADDSSHTTNSYAFNGRQLFQTGYAVVMGMIKRAILNGTVHWKIREIGALQAGLPA